MIRHLALLACAGMVAGCSLVPGAERSESPARGSLASAEPPISVAPAARQCLADLGATRAVFAALPDRTYAPGCSAVNAVQLSALQADEDRIALADIGPVACGVADVFEGWARFGVDRAARQLLGSGVRTIETFGSYSCRPVAGTSRLSGHATAQAIDVSGFVLADGRRITVKDDWSGGSAEEREFLRTVQRSACRRFATVLGPDYNAAHKDHLHVEGVISGRSFCR